MRTDNDRIDIRELFQDLFFKCADMQCSCPIYAAPYLSRKLYPVWPDLKFTAHRGGLSAADAGRIPTRGAGLAFRTALLRAPVVDPGVWTSSTISQSWKGDARHLGIGERLLARDGGGVPSVRGASVAATVISDQLGDSLATLPREAERALTGGNALVASGNPVEDRANLSRLLESGDAAKLVVMVRAQDSRVARAARRAGAVVLPLQNVSPWAVANVAEAVHAPPHDDIAVIARMVGRPVYTQGVRVAHYPAAVLAAAYLIQGSRYLDPADGRPISCEAFLDRLLEWRRLYRKIPSVACFVGISFWKRGRMAEFTGGSARFAKSVSGAIDIAVKTGGGIAAWPSRTPKHLEQAAAAAGVAVFRIEDGFIRSRGLGADFIPPASVIIDRLGIYYDATKSSDLEVLLSDHVFTPELLDRARRLMANLVSRRITKYNLGGERLTIGFPKGRRRILVPGQVADDLSVKAGGAGVAPGLSLLSEVRRRNPDSFIAYKPHPDVEAGHRRGAIPDAALLRFADAVVRDIAIDSLIEAVDEVHTVTSLAGFEALLRHRSVVTYGRPFYAGWGLTTDIHPPAGRGRRLTHEELVAATLILYPHYIDPVTRLPCGPEQLIERLDCAEAKRTSMLIGLRRGQGTLRRVWTQHIRGTA